MPKGNPANEQVSELCLRFAHAKATRYLHFDPISLCNSDSLARSHYVLCIQNTHTHKRGLAPHIYFAWQQI